MTAITPTIDATGCRPDPAGPFLAGWLSVRQAKGLLEGADAQVTERLRQELEGQGRRIASLLALFPVNADSKGRQGTIAAIEEADLNDGRAMISADLPGRYAPIINRIHGGSVFFHFSCPSGGLGFSQSYGPSTAPNQAEPAA